MTDLMKLQVLYLGTCIELREVAYKDVHPYRYYDELYTNTYLLFEPLFSHYGISHLTVKSLISYLKK